MPKGRMSIQGVSMDGIGRAMVRLPGTAPLEIARGINDAGGQVATIVRHALQDQMGLQKYQPAMRAVHTTPATPDHLRYDIWSARGGLPIKDFAAIATPSGIQAHVWGVDKTFQRSFLTSKRGLMLARVGDARMPIRALFGPAPYKELLKGEVLKAFDRSVPMLVEPIVMRRVQQLLP